MGGKKKYIDMFVSLTEPFNCVATTMFIIKPAVRYSLDTAERITSPGKDSVYKQAVLIREQTARTIRQIHSMYQTSSPHFRG